ncbi:MAG: plastocyanin/azurin family copper-binding protein [Actinomycetota bacterium]|nr:plastocyanin/azurin family copper-binding protein [Actinomycetota bacterium]
MRFNRHPFREALLLGVAVVGVACGGGGAGQAEDADRVIEVEMVDNAFNPASIDVSSGQTVNFRFKNNGSIAHDAFIGDEEAQQEHAEAMENESGGHGAHGGEGIVVDPGDTGEYTYTFDEAGQVLIGCHQPGHYEAGMRSTITVGD